MHVAALASISQRSHYSNYGTGIGICAPTSNSHRYRRLQVRGLGITAATGSAADVTHGFGGTSSATPLVAGVAALTISANPDLTALEVISILKQTASKDLSLQTYPRTPPASFDLDTSWDVSPVAPFDQGDFEDIGEADGTWSPWFGHGRANAPAAVAEALRRRQPATGQALRKASTPGREIPDNSATGIRDAITFTDAGNVASIKVSVDISHTFIGDLTLTLIAPSGASVVLHNRNGGNADNVRRSFDLGSTPGLAVLSGQAIRGDWTLLAQDLAALDTGRLNRWEIEIGAQGAAAEAAESPGVMIPDNNPGGIERTLNVAQAGQIRDIDVTVDITHTYIGDLNVTLLSPGGAQAILHSRSGGAQDNLLATYRSSATPALAAFRGQPMQGAWRLKVADLEAVDVGKLNRWSLKIMS
jgi:subtilisin-like proprotein convertase family protein